ncbi:putative PIG3 family NAD(P)H quinone oxidoreductase [Sphingobacterium alimentarium]|uniref:Putative PIG3 family NAD(P)H quinone oxidoreductase n=1 Tax=Sphingobacterium alimentarium TaxID=797292 RepID=A0A4R3VR33_9SPHI|nr:NAD(P)H-quinone oxidoreductase [Sphingobacterium alimentarium]TCV07417.1 putative PIG3 family NAD(P)H quinone oxidoreductase [Sphingobacterium alimentarium]
MMKAVVIKQFGGPEVLQVEDRPIPIIAENEVLIAVKAAGINRPDVFQRMGKYPAPPSVVQDIPGLEVSGIIEEVGSEVRDFQIGDRVIALVPGGGYASHVSVHYGSCIHLQDSVDLVAAAALPETMYTVWHNMVERGKLQTGERVLIHGGAGGIGSTAIQLAKLSGAEVVTTISSEKKAHFVKKLGADEIINYKNEDFESNLLDSKVHLVLDYIGGDYFNKNINILHEDGRLIYINAMSGAKVNLNLIKLMQKRLTISGSTLRNRSAEFKKSLSSAIQVQVMPWITAGKFEIPIYKQFHFTEAKQAHELMESGDFLGKIVLVF